MALKEEAAAAKTKCRTAEEKLSVVRAEADQAQYGAECAAADAASAQQQVEQLRGQLQEAE